MAATISTLSEAPSNSDNPADFETKALAFVAGLSTFVSEANTLASEMETDATNAETAATNAAASASTAQAASNFKGNWSGLTGALNTPASVRHSSQYWALLTDLADVTASEPGVSADWTRLRQPWNVTTTAISRTASAYDHVRVTAAGTTQTLPASPYEGDEVAIEVGAFTDTAVGRNSETIMGLSENCTLNGSNRTYTLRYSNSNWVFV